MQRGSSEAWNFPLGKVSLWVRFRGKSSTSDAEAHRCKQPKGKFLMQVGESAREEVQLELVLTSKEELVEDMKVEGSLDCGDYEILGL